MYEERKTFDVLKGTVPDFASRDINLAYTIDGVTQTDEFPSKDSRLYGVSVKCQNNATAEWDNDKWGLFNITPNKNKKINCTIGFIKPFSSYLMDKVEENENLVKATHEKTEQTGDNATTDYRYTGSNPDNYVCFGSEDETCPDDNLYRIIGVIPTQSEIDGAYEYRVKLIKADFYTEEESKLLNKGPYTPTTEGGYNWTSLSNVDNRWEKSDLNTKVLNGVYWNSLTETYQKYIENAVWYLGALNNNIATYNSESLYTTERSTTPPLYSTDASKAISTNIGLIYPSDLAYSLSKEHWVENINTGSSASLNIKESWLYIFKENQGAEWFITSEAHDNNRNGYASRYYGYYGTSTLNFSAAVIKYSTHYFGIRPTFYLANKVQYKSGEGTKGNPYRISIAE